MSPAGGVTSEEFRLVCRCYPTGVAVLTAGLRGEMVGMAANSVTSVSLEPPLMLVSPAKTSQTWPQIRAAGAFCINVMGYDHQELVQRFARRGEDRFAGVEVHERECGPGLNEAIAWIDCRIERELDAGDHTIVLGDVVAVETGPRLAPLIFWQGAYGKPALTSVEPG